MRTIREIIGNFPQLEALIRPVFRRLRWLLFSISHTGLSAELLRECIGKEDPVILEIGCNDGTDTLRFLEMFANPKIYCFEPDPRAIARFKANVAGHSNVSLFEMALSDQIGEVTFHASDGQPTGDLSRMLPEGWDHSGSIRQPTNHLAKYPEIKFTRTITVKTSTLDAWCDEHGIQNIDFIWMDVQGAEIDVFRGGAATLTKTRFVHTEYSNQELYAGQLTLKELIKHLGFYETVIRFPMDVLLRNKKLVDKKNYDNAPRKGF